MRNRFLLASCGWVALSLVLTGCAGQATDYSGSWSLQVSTSQAGATPAEKDGLVLAKDGTGKFMGAEGTWAVSGNTLTFTEAKAGMVSFMQKSAQSPVDGKATFTIVNPTKLEWTLKNPKGVTGTFTALKAETK